MARAEVHSSQLLLIDEGTSAIDQAVSQAILHELLKSKRTVVLIAHNLPAKERALFDRELALTAFAQTKIPLSWDFCMRKRLHYLTLQRVS